MKRTSKPEMTIDTTEQPSIIAETPEQLVVIDTPVTSEAVAEYETDEPEETLDEYFARTNSTPITPEETEEDFIGDTADVLGDPTLTPEQRQATKTVLTNAEETLQTPTMTKQRALLVLNKAKTIDAEVKLAFETVDKMLVGLSNMFDSTTLVAVRAQMLKAQNVTHTRYETEIIHRLTDCQFEGASLASLLDAANAVFTDAKELLKDDGTIMKTVNSGDDFTWYKHYAGRLVTKFQDALKQHGNLVASYTLTPDGILATRIISRGHAASNKTPSSANSAPNIKHKLVSPNLNAVGTYAGRTFKLTSDSTAWRMTVTEENGKLLTDEHGTLDLTSVKRTPSIIVNEYVKLTPDSLSRVGVPALFKNYKVYADQ